MPERLRPRPRRAAKSAGGTTSARAQVQAYLAARPPASRRTLQKIRTAIRRAAPGAVEHFSYRIPGFKLDGRPLVWYAAFANHTSIYPITAPIRRALADEIEGYDTSTGTIRFPIGAPPSATLIRKLVKARIAEMRKRRA